eukprot:NODE_1106_length_2603_cov_21.041599.p1 GENE.NODE_1106_length_2603_cov_21.041599~~NODE_1106_length_2603_cov_21.041599.p1  ORF type:complete len:740 (+),score=211.17 NODE_1106_length_2603_cov_21.041599:56-2275(+)
MPADRTDPNGGLLRWVKPLPSPSSSPKAGVVRWVDSSPSPSRRHTEAGTASVAQWVDGGVPSPSKVALSPQSYTASCANPCCKANIGEVVGDVLRRVTCSVCEKIFCRSCCPAVACSECRLSQVEDQMKVLLPNKFVLMYRSAAGKFQHALFNDRAASDRRSAELTADRHKWALFDIEGTLLDAGCEVEIISELRNAFNRSHLSLVGKGVLAIPNLVSELEVSLKSLRTDVDSAGDARKQLFSEVSALRSGTEECRSAMSDMRGDLIKLKDQLLMSDLKGTQEAKRSQQQALESNMSLLHERLRADVMGIVEANTADFQQGLEDARHLARGLLGNAASMHEEQARRVDEMRVACNELASGLAETEHKVQAVSRSLATELQELWENTENKSNALEALQTKHRTEVLAKLEGSHRELEVSLSTLRDREMMPQPQSDNTGPKFRQDLEDLRVLLHRLLKDAQDTTKEVKESKATLAWQWDAMQAITQALKSDIEQALEKTEATSRKTRHDLDLVQVDVNELQVKQLAEIRSAAEAASLDARRSVESALVELKGTQEAHHTEFELMRNAVDAAPREVRHSIELIQSDMLAAQERISAELRALCHSTRLELKGVQDRQHAEFESMRVLAERVTAIDAARRAPKPTIVTVQRHHQVTVPDDLADLKALHAATESASAEARHTLQAVQAELKGSGDGTRRARTSTGSGGNDQDTLLASLRNATANASQEALRTLEVVQVDLKGNRA